MTFLLETNVCIAALRSVPGVVARMRALSPDDCAVSMISVQELFAGVLRCREPEREGEKVRKFLEPLHLLPFDWDSALRTASVRHELSGRGLGIGPYDSQLAGQALALDLILVTHNQREFSRVEALRLEDWESNG
jgi:tRNA(fMet)-specific endonuclease VapC